MKNDRTKAGKYDYALTTVLVVTLVLLGVLLGLTVAWRIRRGSPVGAEEQEICEPCSALQSDNNPPKGCNIIKDSVKKTDKCCCKASTVISKLTEKSAQVNFKDFRVTATAAVLKTDCMENKKPSGKVVGIDFESLKEDEDTVHFKPKQQIQESVTYSNGMFNIAKSGFYYVFSQIKYEHDNESAQNVDAKQSHTLHRSSTNNDDKEKLLENTRTFSQLRTSTNNGTSFIGAVFELFENDKLMVQTTHTHRLSGYDHENFFGLYII